MSKPFAFRKFTVSQNKASFKVGTDSVLLGAWTQLDHPKRILDIGCGTGVLSLMMAQRSTALIDAVEIDPLSAQEAAENFQKSPWPERLNVLTTDITTYQSPTPYDLIISNPPYFNEGVLPGSQRKSTARHTGKLSFERLASSIHRLMGTNGCFSCILPADEFEQFSQLLRGKGIFLNHVCEVSSFDQSPVIRKMGIFEFTNQEMNEDKIYLYENEKRDRSDAYHSLTKEFYL